MKSKLKNFIIKLHDFLKKNWLKLLIVILTILCVFRFFFKSTNVNNLTLIDNNQLSIKRINNEDNGYILVPPNVSTNYYAKSSFTIPVSFTEPGTIVAYLNHSKTLTIEWARYQSSTPILAVFDNDNMIMYITPYKVSSYDYTAFNYGSGSDNNLWGYIATDYIVGNNSGPYASWGSPSAVVDFFFSKEIQTQYNNNPLVSSVVVGQFDDGSYNNGYQVGQQVGFTNGYNTGKNEGYNNGYNAGYENGKIDGAEDGYGFNSLIYTIFNAPSKLLQSFVPDTINILGVNLQDFIFSIIGLGIVLLVIRLLFKGGS